MKTVRRRANSPEKGRRLGKLKIMEMSAAWLVITLIVTAMLFFAAHMSKEAIENQRVITERTIRCVAYAEKMQSGSDVLTNAVWRFAATGKVQHANEYLEELTVTLSRDKAIEGLKKEELPKDELDMIENAKKVSDHLMEQELHYIRLVYEAEGILKMPDAVRNIELTQGEKKLSAADKKTKARQFVFGGEYEAAKKKIEENVNEFIQTLNDRQTAELKDAMRRTDYAQSLQQITAVVILIWCIGFMICFYRALIRPIYDSCTELKTAKDKYHKLTMRGTSEIRSLIAAFNDAITRIQHKNEEILNIQMVDPVTGGFTVTRFDLEVERLLHEKKEFSFISMDIRRFKLINDVYGSDVGNIVLKTVYCAILHCLNPGECVSRIQSDMFNFILFETDAEKIKQKIETMHQCLAKEYRESNRTTDDKYHLALNCGVYQVKAGEHDIVSIRDRANVARKISKDEAEYLAGCVFYTDLERQRLLKEQVMENEMEQALLNEEFLVYLQPKVRLSDGKTAGAEALVRWKSSSYGLIPPNEFIPLFEKNGFIIKLDYYMFSHVCRLLREWIDAGKKVVPVSVNLSRKHMKEQGVIARLKEIQEEYQVPCELIELELTEEFVFEDLERFKSIISEIHEAGYRCSMDDFGSGYSSLNVLKEISVDILKLDRGFFVGADIECGDTQRGTNVVKAVIRMAKELNMEVVAEGVETGTLVDFLREQGCDMVQGYIFYRPMPAQGFMSSIL